MTSDHRQADAARRRRVASTPVLACALICAAVPALFACGGGNKTTGQALWVANGANVVEFVPGEIKGGSSMPAPHLANNSAVFGAPQGVVFDVAGDLWVIDGGTMGAGGGNVPPALQMFTPTQLAALHTNAAPAPSVTIASPSFKFPQQAVFDTRGDLWVSDNGNNAVYVFMPDQLKASSTTVVPAITITSQPAFNGPLGIALDARGDLYVANNGTTTIFGFNASQLPVAAGTVQLTPNVMLSDNGNGSIQGPWGLAFDANGNLWSSNANAPNTLVKFAAASLAMTGSPTPAVTISPTTVGGNMSLVAPNGIAFDLFGEITAISAEAPFGVALYNVNQVMTGGALVPAALLVGAGTTLNAPAGCNYGPLVN